MDAKTMGDYIHKCRKEKGLTQRQLADIINVTDKAVSRWERGVGYPDINLLEPLSSALGISVSELIFGDKMTEAVKGESQNVENVVMTSLNLAKTQLKYARRKCSFSLIVSYILMIIGIVTSTYYISNIQIRAIMVLLLVVNGMFISAVLREMILTADRFR